MKRKLIFVFILGLFLGGIVAQINRIYIKPERVLEELILRLKEHSEIPSFPCWPLASREENQFGVSCYEGLKEEEVRNAPCRVWTHGISEMEKEKEITAGMLRLVVDCGKQEVEK